MDAAQKSLSKIAFLVSAALLMGAPALAQTLQVSTNTVTLPVAGGGNTVPVSVTSSTEVTIAFSVVAPAGSFFKVTPTGPQTTPITLTVELQSAPLVATTGTFTLTVGIAVARTITVNYVPGGGGTPTGTITASPNQLTPVVAFGGSVQSPGVTLATGSIAAVPFSVAVSAAAGVPVFATAAVNAFQTSAASPATLTVTSNAAGLANNSTYINTVTVTPTSGGAATAITVTLTVGAGGSGGSYQVSPNIINFNYPSGIQSQAVSVTSNNGAVTTFNATATSSNGWLVLSNNLTQLFNQPVTSGLTLLVNSSAAAQLTTGTVTGTVTLYNPVNSSDFTTITVYLGVNSGTIPNLTLSPSTVTFNSVVNGGQLQIPVSVSATNAGATSFFVNGVSGSWLSASASSSVLPATLTLTANPTGLGAGTYTGSVNLTFSGSVNGAQSLPVTLVVGGGGTVSGAVAPATLNFAYQINSGTLVPQQYVTVNGSGAIAVSVVTSGNQSWLSATGTPTAPGTVVVYVIPSGLPAGDYTGTVTIATSSGTSQVSVNLKVTASSVIYANPPTINLNSAQYSTTVSVTASDNSVQTFTASSSANWVTLSSASGSTPGGFNVNVNPAGLPNGINTANITITAPNAANNPITVPVVALVTGSTGGAGSVTATPTSLTFNYQTGGTAPAAQTVALASASGASGVTATVTTATTSGGNWLSAGIASGSTVTTPANLNVTATVTGLAAGTYQGTITVTPTGGTAVAISVTLTVTAQSITASTADGTTLSYAYRAGDATPAAQSITVAGSGTFSATAQSTGNWLSVSPGTGTAPATVSATINPANLAAGTYNGTVTVAGTGGATGSTAITVSLVVTAPLPTVSRVTSAASFVSGAISPGEIVSLFGTAIGPTAAVGLALDQNGRVSTSIGGVQVLVNGFLAPLAFASSTQINAVVPYEVKGQQSAAVYVRYLGQTSNVVTVQVAATAPGLFTANSSGTGPAAVIYPNPTLATATRGDTIVLYGTGEGETSPAGVTGRVTPGTTPFTVPLLTPVVLIDGQPATVSFFGEAPTYTSGLLQLNVQIPQTARSGDLPVVLRIGGVDSQPNVTISVR